MLPSAVAVVVASTFLPTTFGYAVERVSPRAASTTIPTAGNGYTFSSCYTDAVGSRTLATASFYSDSMTVETCQANCAAYQYFGVEYSRECYCSNEIDNGGTVAANTDCNMPCKGNSSEYCGAGNRVQVYQNTMVPTIPSGGSGYSFANCYTDSSSARALTSATYYSSSMTVEMCQSNCALYGYFGVEYGQECYCGDKISNSNVAAAKTDCNMPCPGNSSELCGAASRIQVYSNNLTSQATAISGYTYNGCYTDSSSSRAMSGASTVSMSMTVEMCASFCSGYSMFGLEYGTQCYCANSLVGSSVSYASGCSMKCAGNSAESCGGPNRLNVYNSTGAVASSSTVSASSSSIPAMAKYTSAYTSTAWTISTSSMPTAAFQTASSSSIPMAAMSTAALYMSAASSSSMAVAMSSTAAQYMSVAMDSMMDTTTRASSSTSSTPITSSTTSSVTSTASAASTSYGSAFPTDSVSTTAETSARSTTLVTSKATTTTSVAGSTMIESSTTSATLVTSRVTTTTSSVASSTIDSSKSSATSTTSTTSKTSTTTSTSSAAAATTAASNPGLLGALLNPILGALLKA